MLFRSAGTANTGGGGGGGGQLATPSATGYGGAGGSGVVILSIPTANYTAGNVGGAPTITTNGSNTVLTFNASGWYKA